MLKIKRTRETTDGHAELLSSRGPFETDTAERGRPVLIRLRPTFVELRLKGLRQSLTVPYSIIYLKAAEIEARRIRMEKLNAKMAKRRELVKR